MSKVYAAESPGGYQLVGRTIDNIWDPSLVAGPTKGSSKEQQHNHQQFMFRIFDQISFYTITEAELDAAQASGTQGDLVRVEDGVLDLAAHEAWVKANREDIAATAAQRARAIGAAPFLSELTRPREDADAADGGSAWAGPEEKDEACEEDGCERVRAGIPGRCWRLLVDEGDRVKAGSVLVSLRLSPITFFSGCHSCLDPDPFRCLWFILCGNGLTDLVPARPTSSRARWRSRSRVLWMGSV